MTFALIGDYQYREVMEMNVRQIKELHPDSGIVIGDLGGNSDWKLPVFDLSGQDKREALMMMKPLFLMFLISRGSGEFCLMDGDMVLMKELDIGCTTVTARESRHGRLNSGIVVSGDPNFAAEWLKNGIKRLAGADISKEVLCEQNALIDTVDSGKFTANEVPCDIYNYSKVEEGIPDDVKVVHLKSGRFKDPNMVGAVHDHIRIRD